MIRKQSKLRFIARLIRSYKSVRQRGSACVTSPVSWTHKKTHSGWRCPGCGRHWGYSAPTTGRAHSLITRQRVSQVPQTWMHSQKRSSIYSRSMKPSLWIIQRPRRKQFRQNCFYFFYPRNIPIDGELCGLYTIFPVCWPTGVRWENMPFIIWVTWAFNSVHSVWSLLKSSNPPLLVK